MAEEFNIRLLLGYDTDGMGNGLLLSTNEARTKADHILITRYPIWQISFLNLLQMP